MPTIDFSLDPWVNPKQVQRDAKEDPEADSISASNAKDGGRLYVSGSSRLDDATGRCYVEFGIALEVNSGDKDFHPFTYAMIAGGAFKNEEIIYEMKHAPMRILHDKPRAVTALKRRIVEAIEVAIRRGSPKGQIAKLKKFRNALR